jgi:membrane protease YdiL (CAAX protease family)
MRPSKRLDLWLKQEPSKERASSAANRVSWSGALELAPRWHTMVLVGLIVAVFLSGTLLGRSLPSHPSSASRVGSVYLPLLAVEWALAFYVARVGRTHSALSGLLGRRWHSPARAAVDLALAAAVFAQIQGIELLSRFVFGGPPNPARDALLPASPSEYAVWILVAVSAGFCEELVYRGYLLVQLGAFSGSVASGCVLSAALFGLAHAEQGAAVALRFALYGVLLGALAVWRRSLIPGALAHVALDVAAAVLR